MYGSSRLGRVLNGIIAGSATGFTTRFGTETYQIRVETQTTAWAAVFDSTAALVDFNVGVSTSTSSSTTATVVTKNGTLLDTGMWDYWTVTPGQFLAWRSTSTSTVGIFSVTEMS